MNQKVKKYHLEFQKKELLYYERKDKKRAGGRVRSLVCGPDWGPEPARLEVAHGPQLGWSCYSLFWSNPLQCDNTELGKL